LRTGKYLFIQAPRRELYQDGTDPESTHNLASSSRAIADTLSAKLKRLPAFDDQHAANTKSANG